MSDSIDGADFAEIHHLINRIAATADTADDIQDYLDLVAPDAVFDFAPVPSVGLEAQRYSGHAEIRAGVVARREAGMQGPGSGTLHIVSDVAVESVRGDEAAVHAAWQYLGLRDGVPALLSMGTYANTVRRHEGRWLLAERVVTVY
jgi:3-phenylpropionate/cinnamic acid dioxygenase small subunit